MEVTLIFLSLFFPDDHKPGHDGPVGLLERREVRQVVGVLARVGDEDALKEGGGSRWSLKQPIFVISAWIFHAGLACKPSLLFFLLSL